MDGYDDSHGGNSGSFCDDAESNGSSRVERSFDCLGRVLVNIVDEIPTYDAQTGWKRKSCLSRKKTMSEFASNFIGKVDFSR